MTNVTIELDDNQAELIQTLLKEHHAKTLDRAALLTLTDVEQAMAWVQPDEIDPSPKGWDKAETSTNWKLVTADNDQPLNVGDIALTFARETVKIVAVSPPHKPSSTGHVTVEFENGGPTREYFPGVINAKFVQQ
jgi:hypothetical protein